MFIRQKSTKAHLGLIVAVGLLSACAPARWSNPIVSDQFVADPSAHVFGDRVYLYATNDSGNSGEYWDSTDWRAFSSADMAHWTDHGGVFSLSGFSWARQYAWAPDAVYRDGSYFLFLPVDKTKIGVARADSPTGPFVDAIGAPLVDIARDANVGDEPIDPAVFIDHDGQAYMYFGTRVPKMVRLDASMTRLSGGIENVEIRDASVAYGEAPWLHERNGVYYFSYSTGWPGQIAYATGGSPTGPFTYRGLVLDYVNIYTNHHAIIERDGEWYVFYHTAALPGSGDRKRSISIDRLRYAPDGAIVQVEMTAPFFGEPREWQNQPE